MYLRDDENKYDIRVRDCWAYDDQDYNARGTSKLQLTDDEGCPRQVLTLLIRIMQLYFLDESLI